MSDAPVTVLDVKPTIEALVGARAARPVDGGDLSALWAGDETQAPARTLVFYRDDRLQALRRGRWKLHVHRPEWRGEAHAPLLFDLVADPGEAHDLAHEQPALVAELLDVAQATRLDLGDAVQGAIGTGVRPVGQLERD